MKDVAAVGLAGWAAGGGVVRMILLLLLKCGKSHRICAPFSRLISSQTSTVDLHSRSAVSVRLSVLMFNNFHLIGMEG